VECPSICAESAPWRRFPDFVRVKTRFGRTM
jgi:hypothetical protein